VHVLAFAMRAALGKVERMVVEIQQGAHGGRALDENVTSIAPIAAVWPSARDKLLATKANTAVSPATTTHENFRLINDTRTFQKPLSFTTSKERDTGACADGGRVGESIVSGSPAYAACTLMRRFFLPLFSNCTTPSIRAKSV
jgi:hypothetical protein